MFRHEKNHDVAFNRDGRRINVTLKLRRMI
jgi:hypothetical protein